VEQAKEYVADVDIPHVFHPQDVPVEWKNLASITKQEVHVPPAVGYADRNSARETARHRLQMPAATQNVSEQQKILNSRQLTYQTPEYRNRPSAWQGE
jgi:hypothetical protein